MSLGYDSMIIFWSLEGGKPELEVKLPLKTYTCAFDYPYLLIGSCKGTIYVVNVQDFPSCKFPKESQDYKETKIT